MTRKKMTKKELEVYKKLLLKEKANLLHDIKNMSDAQGGNGDSGDVSGHVQHMADVATDMYDKEFMLGLASKEREVLQKIEEALRKIEKGTYGPCEECEELIAKPRLEAIPYAKLCLKCQEEEENRKP
jgi:RNA polymerase-binding protein DksA